MSKDGKLLLKIHATDRRYHQWFVRSRELQVDDLVPGGCLAVGA
jgi:hypothetical protein